MDKTDLLIIGSGPGGYRTASYAAKNGLHVTIIEKDQLGIHPALRHVPPS